MEQLYIPLYFTHAEDRTTAGWDITSGKFLRRDVNYKNGKMGYEYNELTNKEMQQFIKQSNKASFCVKNYGIYIYREDKVKSTISLLDINDAVVTKITDPFNMGIDVLKTCEPDELISHISNIINSLLFCFMYKVACIDGYDLIVAQNAEQKLKKMPVVKTNYSFCDNINDGYVFSFKDVDKYLVIEKKNGEIVDIREFTGCKKALSYFIDILSDI